LLPELPSFPNPFRGITRLQAYPSSRNSFFPPLGRKEPDKVSHLLGEGFRVKVEGLTTIAKLISPSKKFEFIAVNLPTGISKWLGSIM
jgi:hypothetical protein